jgi:hypothetical protein
MKRVAGICFVKADGVQFDVSGGLEVPLAQFKRETVMSVNGPAGMKETVNEPYIKLTAINTADFPTSKLQQSTEMTVTAEFPNGTVYVLSEAFLKGEGPVKADDGTIELEFGGRKGMWQ